LKSGLQFTLSAALSAGNAAIGTPVSLIGQLKSCMTTSLTATTITIVFMQDIFTNAHNHDSFAE
jgi:hypothetical protein